MSSSLVRGVAAQDGDNGNDNGDDDDDGEDDGDNGDDDDGDNGDDEDDDGDNGDDDGDNGDDEDDDNDSGDDDDDGDDEDDDNDNGDDDDDDDDDNDDNDNELLPGVEGPGIEGQPIEGGPVIVLTPTPVPPTPTATPFPTRTPTPVPAETTDDELITDGDEQRLALTGDRVVLQVYEAMPVGIRLTLRLVDPDAYPSTPGQRAGDLTFVVEAHDAAGRPLGALPAEAGLSVHYAESDVGGYDDSNVILARLDPSTGQWIPAPRLLRDPSVNFVAGSIFELGVYAVYLP
jgi:hypothetical protein